MAQITGTGTIWNLPNYAGELFTADAENTPFLTMIGGMSGGKQSDNFEFPISSQYDYRAAAQPDVDETTSATAPSANEAVRTQNKNVCQIHHEAIDITYEKLANAGRLSGINSQGNVNNVSDEKNFQIAYNLKTIARDIEYSFLNGTYQISTDAATSNQTRGMLAACTTTAIDAASATLSKDMIDEMMRTAADGGAQFSNMVLFLNAFQIQKISDLYGYAPEDRTVGGVAIKQILTDFATLGVVYDRFMPTDDILMADVSSCAPVFQPVPGKGNFFYEDLAKTGAAEKGQLFGKIGLSYGTEFLHGKIHSLATS